MSYSFSFEKVPDDKEHVRDYERYTVWRFYGYHMFIPFSIYCFLNLCAAIYSVFALTRTSVRYVYIDV